VQQQEDKCNNSNNSVTESENHVDVPTANITAPTSTANNGNNNRRSSTTVHITHTAAAAQNSQTS
jgi:hypothetical protein